ncbi:MAG: hypothetical protein NVS2B7_26700 [Herpetosiphon sp.]
MALMVSDDQLRAFLKLPFLMDYGFELDRIGDGMCTLLIPFAERWARPGGFVSGPLYMAAADVAMWFAVMTRLGPEEQEADGRVRGAFFTSDMQTAFLNAARSEDVVCGATVLKMGRRLIFGVVECRSRDGRLLTHHTLSLVRPDGR